MSERASWTEWNGMTAAQRGRQWDQRPWRRPDEPLTSTYEDRYVDTTAGL